MQKIDEHFMGRALKLALRGEGHVHPNPLVGAVLVKNGRALSEGAHEYFGGPHAEVNALRRSKQGAQGATLYVTLEPCAHTGKTPPCTELILRHGVRRVVAAMKDPNPRVSGRGFRRLKNAGVKVATGVLEKEAKELNRHYAYWLSKKKPYVTVKAGQSLDGKIATKTGESHWITSKASRRLAHELRRSADAILVGVSTVLKDDPLLTVRLPGPRTQPVKVVLDAELRTPPRARLFSKKSPGRVLLFTSRRAKKSRRKTLGAKAEVVTVPEKKRGRLDWKAVLAVLGKKGVTHLLIEGGGEVLESAFSSGVVREAYFFTAPIVIGGKKAVSSVSGEGISELRRAARFKTFRVRRVGDDFLFHGVL